MGVLTGGNCSRARVESISAMNEGIVYAQSQRTIDAIKKRKGDDSFESQPRNFKQRKAVAVAHTASDSLLAAL